MANEFKKLRKRQRADISAIPTFWAYDQKGFDEGMRKLGLNPKDTDKICFVLDTGMHCKKEDWERFRDISKKHSEEMWSAILDDKTGEGFIKDMFLYELEEHEFSGSEDVWKMVDELPFTYGDFESYPALMHGLEEAENAIRGCRCVFDGDDERMTSHYWQLDIDTFAFLDQYMIAKIGADINAGAETGECDCPLEWKFEIEGKIAAETQKLIAGMTDADENDLLDCILDELWDHGVCNGNVHGLMPDDDETLWTLKLYTPATSYGDNEIEIIVDILAKIAKGAVKGLEFEKISWTLDIEGAMTDGQRDEAMRAISKNLHTDKISFGTVQVHEEKEELEQADEQELTEHKGMTI